MTLDQLEKRIQELRASGVSGDTEVIIAEFYDGDVYGFKSLDPTTIEKYPDGTRGACFDPTPEGDEFRPEGTELVKVLGFKVLGEDEKG